MKGLPAKSKVFNLVIENIKKVIRRTKELGTNCDVGFKFLLHPVNFHEIYDAAKLAKDLGIQDFHLRPVRYSNFTRINDWIGLRLKYQNPTGS